MVSELKNIENTDHCSYALLTMKQVEIQSLAEQFVIQYYTVMNQSPKNLHQFYTEESTMIHEQSPNYGQTQIHEKFLEFNFKNAQVGILSLDALKAHENSILIQVSGEMSKNTEEPRRFMQSFILCEQSTRNFFILNDIFHYQDKVFDEKKHESTGPPSDISSIEKIQSPKQPIHKEPIEQNGLSNHLNQNWNHAVNEQPNREHSETLNSVDIHIKESEVHGSIDSHDAHVGSSNAVPYQDVRLPVEDSVMVNSADSSIENTSEQTISRPAAKSWAQMASSGVSGPSVVAKVTASVQPTNRPSMGRGMHSGTNGSSHRGINRDNGRPMNTGEGRRSNDGANHEGRFYGQNSNSGAPGGGSMMRGRGGSASGNRGRGGPMANGVMSRGGGGPRRG